MFEGFHSYNQHQTWHSYVRYNVWRVCNMVAKWREYYNKTGKKRSTCSRIPGSHYPLFSSPRDFDLLTSVGVKRSLKSLCSRGTTKDWCKQGPLCSDCKIKTYAAGLEQRVSDDYLYISSRTTTIALQQLIRVVMKSINYKQVYMIKIYVSLAWNLYAGLRLI